MIFSHICPIFLVLLLFMKVYTWGRGDDGRLGHGDNGWKYVPRICQSLTGQVVTQVTCGSYHTAAVTGNGDLWTWGGGMYGKLGHGNEAGCSTPKRVEGLAGLVVAQIACGSRHTTVVTSQGALYSWGDKENGVAGHGEVEGHQYTPRLVERLAGKRVVQLSACGFHTGCLTDALELYTWGGVCFVCVCFGIVQRGLQLLWLLRKTISHNLFLRCRRGEVWPSGSLHRKQLPDSSIGGSTRREKAVPSQLRWISYCGSYRRWKAIHLWVCAATDIVGIDYYNTPLFVCFTTPLPHPTQLNASCQ